MIERHARGVLLDIEGTTSSIRFVYDQMFPFVRRELLSFLEANRESPAVTDAANQIAQDADYDSFAALAQAHDWDVRDPWFADPSARQILHDEVVRQMDADWKTTGLKQLQGLIWKSGFASGELKAHLYPEVADCLKAWHDSGLVLRIYSSGSIAAQKLFFGHTVAGDLLPLVSGHDDTTTGSKKEMSSYQAIADKFGFAPESIVFISDSIDELQAAESAGMQVVWSCRPENPPADNPAGYPAIRSFDALHLVRLPATPV